MDPNGLIEVAEALVKNDGQCFQKSSVNRAYYAAFHSIKAIAEKKLGFVEDRNKPTHKQLSECLMNSENEEVADLGVKLRGLHRQRTICDYHPKEKLTKTDAALAILMSKLLIEAFPQACKSL